MRLLWCLIHFSYLCLPWSALVPDSAHGDRQKTMPVMWPATSPPWNPISKPSFPGPKGPNHPWYISCITTITPPLPTKAYDQCHQEKKNILPGSPAFLEWQWEYPGQTYCSHLEIQRHLETYWGMCWCHTNQEAVAQMYNLSFYLGKGVRNTELPFRTFTAEKGHAEQST